MPKAVHRCPSPGCNSAVPNSQFACRTHWWSLSEDTRNAILATYRGKADHAARMEALGAGVRELRSNARVEAESQYLAEHESYHDYE